MSASSQKPRLQKPLPRWLIFVAVVVTGGTTAWAMSATQLRGPEASWGQAQNAVEQVWAEPGSAEVQGVVQNGAVVAPTTAQPQIGGARPVAGLPGVPIIRNGARRPHPDRGACSNCHTILTGEGTPVPAIHSFSTMPHGFRGICSNCHQITIGRGLTGSPVAATLPMPAGPAMMQQPMAQQPMMQQPMAQQPMMQQPMMQQPMAQQPMMQQPMMQQPMAAPPRAPNEADWRGLEVRRGAQGVVVTNAEGAAARSGLQPGDLVASINGNTMRDVNDFVGATQNGKLPQGTVVVQRGQERLAFELQPRTNQVMPPGGAPTTGLMVQN